MNKRQFLHTQCDNINTDIKAIQEVLKNLEDGKIIFAYNYLKATKKELDEILLHLREEALRVEGKHE